MAATPGASPHATTGSKSGLAIASMVLGILAIPFILLWPIAVILALVGLTLGVIARGAGAGGQATAGIVCSVIALIGVVALLVAAGLSA